jgi:hypothetical protein
VFSVKPFSARIQFVLSHDGVEMNAHELFGSEKRLERRSVLGREEAAFTMSSNELPCFDFRVEFL